MPSYQNLGIGAKAITFIENEFPDATRWRLHTPYKITEITISMRKWVIER